MNREIKFRIYNKKQKKWIHGPGHEVNLFGEVILMGYLLDKVPLAELNDCVALQYTGLKTEDGVEIYEGDILKIETDISDGPYIAEVKYEFGYFCCFKSRSEWSLLGYCSGFCEIIGNVFELPCKPDHNGECLVCDCWLSDCPVNK